MLVFVFVGFKTQSVCVCVWYEKWAGRGTGRLRVKLQSNLDTHMQNVYMTFTYMLKVQPFWCNCHLKVLISFLYILTELWQRDDGQIYGGFQ